MAVLCWKHMALFHCMVRHGTVRYGSLLGGFPLGTVPGTWYFFSTTSAEVPSDPYRYQNVMCKLYWSLTGRRESSLLRHWTCDTRPSSTALPARFKSAQPAKDRTQLLCNASITMTCRHHIGSLSLTEHMLVFVLKMCKVNQESSKVALTFM